ncbi:uncharacterized protein FOMMEDRAFT_162057 [Fomitiporia mediterranea MF3/22]|uniref:uncharacterized protein n=1 Tax=Fomitiporia mediterranea (strain MF3/22) TaxID=694068 RepID=UPI0004408E5D|nr:uncharacterized protein FOMMEDRAFT_162057 [Fomitiporia mediterranea MF3/22]EJC98291.1 hypothetical protein FOMMEDRAFT_162057 [Fomitiporia mediterranea MF3/22]
MSGVSGAGRFGHQLPKICNNYRRVGEGVVCFASWSMGRRTWGSTFDKARTATVASVPSSCYLLCGDPNSATVLLYLLLIEGTLRLVPPIGLQMDSSSLAGVLASGQMYTMLNSLQSTRYLAVACFALLVYDYFLTLEQEIKLFWRAKLTITRVLFFLNRYLPPINFVHYSLEQIPLGLKPVLEKGSSGTYLLTVTLTQHVRSDTFRLEGLSRIKVTSSSCQQSFDYVIIAHTIVLVAQFRLVGF